MFFTDVTDNNNVSSPYCIAHVRPYSELQTDLAMNRTAQYNFLTPNLCDDGHDCGFTDVDFWLSQNLPMIMQSAAYKANGIIFITWDEGSNNSDGPIGFIAISQVAKKGYNNSVAYTHSSLLRTLQDIFKVYPYLNDAANAVSVQDLLTVNLTATPQTSQGPVPSSTSQQPSNGSSVPVIGILMVILLLLALMFVFYRVRMHRAKSVAKVGRIEVV